MANIKKPYNLKAQTKEELKENKCWMSEIQPYTNKEIKFMRIVKEKYGEMLTVRDLAEILEYAGTTIYNHGHRLPKRQAGGNRVLYYIESVIILIRHKDEGMNIVKLRKIKKKVKKIIKDPDKENEIEHNNDSESEK